MAKKRKREYQPKKRNIIILAVILSIILYTAGLISGLSFSNFVQKNLEKKAEQDMALIVEYVKNLDSDLQSIQIQELFVKSLDQNDTCSFAGVYFSEINQNLDYFWKMLPARLEEYESTNQPSKEYLELKKQYTILSLRAWIISKSNYEKCRTDIIPVLYFYSPECDECISQGEVLDQVKSLLADEGKSLIVFTVDYSYSEASLGLIKKYYLIQSVPALIINDEVLQGRLFTESEIIMRLRDAQGNESKGDA